MAADAGWNRGAVSASAAINHVSSYIQNGVTPIRNINAYQTIDLHFGYDCGKSNDSGVLGGLTLAFDMQNVTDEDPPFVNLSGGYDPQSSNPIGSLVAISLRKRW
jgi:iron complex outermembrane recepter protein